MNTNMQSQKQEKRKDYWPRKPLASKEHGTDARCLRICLPRFWTQIRYLVLRFGRCRELSIVNRLGGVVKRLSTQRTWQQ